MIHIISWLASESINRISFYRDTTKFVVWMQESKRFSNIKITGHSLGGGKCSHILNNFELFNLTLRPWLGLSLISGAQAGVNAFALSGPNTLLSRSSFDPPITVDALNKFTFNVIPDRDIVPQLDDVAQLNQRISCTANVNDYASCHDGRRSLCQIIHTCGSQNRPALCECVTEFGYPEPLPKDGVSRTFAEACARK
jgi:lipase ATG15